MLLILSIPLAPNINDVLVYDETDMTPEEVESVKGMDFIDQEFGGGVAESSTIVVLTSNDVLDNDTKRAVYGIDKELFNASHEGRISEDVRVSSLYTSLTSYSAGFLSKMSDSISETTSTVNGTARVVFGIPLDFQELYAQVNFSSFVLYGIPDMHIGIWEVVRASHPNYTVQQVDQEAYLQTVQALESSPQVDALNSSMEAIVWSWLTGYSAAWNSTASNTTLVDNPELRGAASIEGASPSFLSGLPPDYQAFMESTYESFSLLSWDQFHRLSHFCLTTLEDELEGEHFPQAPEDFVTGYLHLFYGLWNASDAPPSAEEFRTMVGQASASYAAEVGGEKESLISLVASRLGLDHWENAQAVRSLAVDLVISEAQAAPLLVRELADLGESPSFTAIHALAESVVKNSTVSDFPLPLPSALVSTMVNVPQNDTMIFTISFTTDGNHGSAVEVIRDTVHTITGAYPAITAYVTGSAAINEDMDEATSRDMERIDPVTVILILILIGIFFRSIVASSVPPASIGVAIMVSLAIVYLIGEYLLALHYSVLAMMVTAMLGAGCDYCIFLLSRYKEERSKGNSERQSVRNSVRWAGEAVTTSGMTVMIGFGSLALSRFGLMKSMGISLALGIFMALLVAITLLPSLLTYFGDRIFWPANLGESHGDNEYEDNSKRRSTTDKKEPGYFEKSARFSVKHAKAIVLAALIISVPATYLVFTLDTSYDFIAGMPDTESKEGLEVMGEGFGEGKINPTLIAVNFTSTVYADDYFNLSKLDEVEDLSEELVAIENVKKVTGLTRPLGEPINYSNLSEYSPLVAAQYEGIMKGMVGKNDTAVLLEVILEDEPYSPASIELADEIRQLCANTRSDSDSIQMIHVTGGTAMMSDISGLVNEDFDTMRVAVVIGIYAVLLVVLGSVLIPLRLILTILLSIAWTIALTMIVFQGIVGTPVLWLVPLILFVICMGLGMDYDILLTTRIREEVIKGKSDPEAIVEAVKKTGKVITACGFIMAGAFSTMMLSSTAMLQQFGFALAFAILLDATVVRIYLVPAIMVLLEKWNWWAPGRLQRVNREEDE